MQGVKGGGAGSTHRPQRHPCLAGEGGRRGLLPQQQQQQHTAEAVNRGHGRPTALPGWPDRRQQPYIPPPLPFPPACHPPACRRLAPPSAALGLRTRPRPPGMVCAWATCSTWTPLRTSCASWRWTGTSALARRSTTTWRRRSRCTLSWRCRCVCAYVCAHACVCVCACAL